MTITAPLRATDAAILEAIHFHRALSTEQIRRIAMPDTKSGPGQAVSHNLSRLAAEKLIVGRILVRSGPKVWCCTPAGLREIDAEQRRAWTPNASGVRLARHTWAVNEVGISLLEAARSRGDDFGPLGWEHEVLIQRHGAKRLIADALIRYTLVGDGKVGFATALLELDRNHSSPGQFTEKLRWYEQVRDDPNLWRKRFPHGWPFLLFVVDAAEAQTRLRSVMAYWRDLNVDSEGAWRKGCLPFRITTLAQVREAGPFAPIWVDPQAPGSRVDWLGREG